MAVAVSVTGVIAALGDTLLPASSVLAGMQQDFSSAAHILLRSEMMSRSRMRRPLSGHGRAIDRKVAKEKLAFTAGNNAEPAFGRFRVLNFGDINVVDVKEKQVARRD